MSKGCSSSLKMASCVPKTFVASAYTPEGYIYKYQKKYKADERNQSQGLSTEKDTKHAIIRRVHKFSIGKDFTSNEIDEEDLSEQLKFNQSIYSNMPPTLSTRSLKSLPKKSTTQAREVQSTSKNSLIEDSFKFSSLTHASFPNFLETSTTRYHVRPVNNKKTTTRSATTSTRASTISPTIVHFNNNNFKIEKIKKNLSTISKKTNVQTINKVLNDLWTIKPLNYSTLTKGRSVEDTRTVLNNMILALHQIKLKEQPNLNSSRFFDQVSRQCPASSKCEVVLVILLAI